MVTIVEQFGGLISNHPGLINWRAMMLAAADNPPRDVNSVIEEDRRMARKMVDEGIKAAYFMSGAK